MKEIIEDLKLEINSKLDEVAEMYNKVLMVESDYSPGINLFAMEDDQGNYLHDVRVVMDTCKVDIRLSDELES